LNLKEKGAGKTKRVQYIIKAGKITLEILSKVNLNIKTLN